MTAVVKARGVRKTYGKKAVLDGIDFDLPAGRIVGLIGSNGAGKTTLLRAMLGLTPYDGELSVLGQEPVRQRDQLMERVGYIADVAVLPRWLKVKDAIEYVRGVHRRFDLERCQALLAKTEVPLNAKIGTLSKGMTAQLHLALVLALDVEVLVLDEPTLGLDIIYRKQFYEYLLADYHERERTIIITTHQVEEIEHLLTDVMFISHGKLVLNTPTEELARRYTEVMVSKEQVAAARALNPISDREVFGRHVMVFENVAREALQGFGDMRVPGLADLFVAKMSGVQS